MALFPPPPPTKKKKRFFMYFVLVNCMGWQVCYKQTWRVSSRTWFDVLQRQRVNQSSSEFWLCPKGWQHVEICDLFQNLNIHYLLTGRMELKQRNMSIVTNSAVKSTCVSGVQTLSSITSLFQNCALNILLSTCHQTGDVSVCHSLHSVMFFMAGL